MANDRWPGSGDGRDEIDGEAGALGPGEESVEGLRSERDARAREAAEAQERYLRTLAEFENFRRRTHREREDWRRQAQETLLREILPVLDNFDRALAAPPARGADPAFRTGVELIHRDFLAALERLGVRPSEPAGRLFAPRGNGPWGGVEGPAVEDQPAVAEPLGAYRSQVGSRHPPRYG